MKVIGPITVSEQPQRRRAHAVLLGTTHFQDNRYPMLNKIGEDCPAQAQVFIKPGIGNNVQTDVILIAANSRAVAGITRANTSRAKPRSSRPPTING